MLSYFQARRQYLDSEKKKDQDLCHWRQDAFSEVRANEKFERQWPVRSFYERKNYAPRLKDRTLQDWAFEYVSWMNREHFGTDFISKSEHLNEPFFPKIKEKIVNSQRGYGWKDIVERAIQVNPPYAGNPYSCFAITTYIRMKPSDPGFSIHDHSPERNPHSYENIIRHASLQTLIPAIADLRKAQKKRSLVHLARAA